jgi:hypothetical protein
MKMDKSVTTDACMMQFQARGRYANRSCGQKSPLKGLDTSGRVLCTVWGGLNGDAGTRQAMLTKNQTEGSAIILERGKDYQEEINEGEQTIGDGGSVNLSRASNARHRMR